MQTSRTRQPSRSIASTRKTSPLALTIFALAYVGALVIVFAPAGSLVSGANHVHAER